MNTVPRLQQFQLSLSTSIDKSFNLDGKQKQRDVDAFSQEVAHIFANAEQGVDVSDVTLAVLEKKPTTPTAAKILRMAEAAPATKMRDREYVAVPIFKSGLKYLARRERLSERKRGIKIAMDNLRNAFRLPSVPITNTTWKGGFSRLYLTQSEGMIFKGRPKFSQTTIAAVASVIGIRMEDPRYLERNIASYIIDQALGFNVIVAAEFARSDDAIGITMTRAYPGKLKKIEFTTCNLDMLDQRSYNTVMNALNKVECETDGKIKKNVGGEGKKAFKALYKIFKTTEMKCEKTVSGGFIFSVGKVVEVYDFYKDPKFRRDIVSLQLEDIICCQADRHSDNYMVERDSTTGAVKRVIAFDGDMSLTTAGIVEPNAHNPEMHYDHNQILGFSGVYLVDYPRVVDTQMMDSLKRLNTEEKKNELRDQLSQYLTEQEIDAVFYRLNHLVVKLDAGIRDGTVMLISSYGWSGEEIHNRLMENSISSDGFETHTSYYARDLDEDLNDSRLKGVPRVPLCLENV